MKLCLVMFGVFKDKNWISNFLQTRMCGLLTNVDKFWSYIFVVSGLSVESKTEMCIWGWWQLSLWKFTGGKNIVDGCETDGKRVGCRHSLLCFWLTPSATAFVEIDSRCFLSTCEELIAIKNWTKWIFLTSLFYKHDKGEKIHRMQGANWIVTSC